MSRIERYLELATQVVVNDEGDGVETVDVIDESERVFFLERKNFQKNSLFVPDSFDDKHDDLPIHGRGRLDLLLIKTDNQNYSINVVIDDREIVNDSWSNLSTIQDELTHISAYETNNKYITTVTDYPFENLLRIEVIPSVNMTFDIVRVEAILE